MNYIVLDLEWNQSNTGREAECSQIPFEIIDFGAIKVNEDGKMIGEFNQLVKPQIYNQMHHITSKIIHLHMQDLQRGKVFSEVMNEFLDFCGEDYIFCTWGTLDLFELQRNMRFYGMEPLSNGPLKYLDLQKLYSLAFEDGKIKRNLEHAVDELNIPKDIPFHRAFSDAYYTAKVLAMLPKEVFDRYSFDTFMLPQTKSEEIHVSFPDYIKYISREFGSKQEAMADKEVASTKCYLCKKPMKKKVRWFSPNGGKHYYSIAECPVHGFLKYKIRVKKTDTESVYIVKTTKFVDEETAVSYHEKRQQVQENKKKKKSQNKEASN
ncbi:MAG: exonuclease domain-containing protein [Lachnospiraceae bacterium]|nr:exonuclease domain-containing protein [Lachnospiraceae bacterium]